MHLRNWCCRSDPDFVWVVLPGVRIIDNQARYRSGVFLAVGDALTLLSGSAVDATYWVDLGFPVMQGNAPTGTRATYNNFMFVSYLRWDTLLGKRSVRKF